MTKIKRWRLILAATLAAFFAVTLCFALQIGRSARAAEDGVLDGNTAEYTIVNDSSHPWDYDRATNIWTNPRNYSSSTKLSIKVTGPGKVVLEYKMNGVDNNTPGSTRYAFKLSDFYVTLKQGTITNTIIAEHGIAMPDYERLELDNLSAGDEIVFSYDRAASDGDEDNLYIKGLNKPQVAPLAVNLTAGDGGQISYQERQGKSFSEEIEFGSPVAFEAIPDATHVFAYWSDKSGNVLSYDPKISIALLSAIDYTANFYQKDGETKVTMGTGWESVTQSADAPTSYNGYRITKGALGQNTKLVFEAVGDYYLTLKYAFLLNYNAAQYASNKITGYYNGDDYVNISGGNILSLNRSSGGQSVSADNLTWNDDFYFHLAGEGYHRLELQFDGTGYPEANDIFAIKDIKWGTQPETVEFELDYDEALGTVYMDDIALQPGRHSVIKGQYVCFSASFKDIMSTIDPTQEASVRFGGFYTKEETQIWPDTQSCYIKFSDSMLKSSRAESSTLYIKANFEEIAILPETSITVTSGSDFQEAVPVKSGDTVVLPYGQENSVSFMFDDFATITEQFTVSVDGEVQSEVKIVEEAGKNFFRLEGIDSNKTVTVQYTADGYFESPLFTLYLVVTNADDISEHLLVDGAKNIEVENDPFVPWVFSAAYTTETDYAYMAGNSGALGYYGKAVSSLKFKVMGAGLLDFDFKLEGGGNFWLVWGEQPISITDTINQAYSGVHANDTDNNGEKFWRINSNDNTDVGRLIAAGCTTTKTVSSNNYMFWLVGGEQWEGKKTTTMLEDGWAHVSIPMGEDATQKTYYVSYYVSSDTYLYASPWSSTPACFAVIRNVGFFSGEGTLNYSISNNDAGSVGATSAGKDVTTGSTIALGSRVTFKATVNEGNQFYGWVNSDGKLLSTAVEYTTSVTDKNFTVKAIVEPKGKYFVRNDGKFYEDLASAIGAAQTDDKLIVIKDGITVSESMELPAGVSLVLPVTDRGDAYELGTNSNSATRVPWSSSQLIEQYKNFTLTVAEGQTLTIKGSLFVGAVEHHPEQYAQGATSGKYNVLDIQGDVVVEEGGHLDVRGLVTGKGGITVKQGGKLTQPFMILDYNGGTNTEASFNAGVTPFKMYAMVNIQCEKGYTVEYGGELWGHASLYFWSSTTTIDTPFITWEGAKGDSEHALLVLKEGAKVTSVYDNGHKRITGVANVEDVGKTTMTVEGGAKAGYMQFPLGINTSGVYFSLPYNYELILTKAEGGEDCTYDLENSFKLMPGSIVRVEKGATLNVVSGKGLHVYDSFSIPNVARRTYPTGAQLKGADYLPYASLIVNGTLNLQDGATFLGTVQTTDTAGKAKIVIGKDVKLSDDTLFDGVATQYTCNYTKYSLVAHVWDKVHEELRPLAAEHTYVSTYADGDTFTLPGITFQIESKTGKHVGEAHTLIDSVTESVDGLKGAWMVEHEHTYDWRTPKEDEKSESIFKGGNSVEIERGCLELGCDEIEKKVLLKSLNTFNSKTYRGTEFTGAELFEELYSGRRAADVGATFTVKDDRLAKDVGTYTITVALEKGYFLTADGTFEASHDFTFVIDRKNVTVSVQDQSSTYTGKEPDVKQGSYTISGLCGDDVLGIVIEKEPGTAAGEYRLTAKANSGANANGNYNIKFSYTASGHSTYTINKATLTVKPNNVSSPAGEEPITDFTSTISGFVNGERGTLEAEIAEQLVYTCTVTKDSPSGRQYAITVKFTGELQNYEVKCESGSYTVTESLFKDVKFKDLVVTYDGTEHSLTVTGTEGLTGAKVEYAPANSYKNAGTYTVTATVTARDSAGKTYTQTYEATLTIERRTVTVELLAQNRVYDGTPASAQSRAGTDWKLADGSVLGTGDELSALGVALTVTAPTKNVGTYAISAVASVNDQQNGNYTVNFSNNNGNLYTITKRDLHITVTEKTTVYGESIDLDQTAWTYDNDTDFIAGDLIHVTLSSDVKKDAGSYHITASADAAMDDNKNYNFLFTDAAWTVSPKEITVVITPVSVTYSGEEPAAPTLWELKAGSELVAGDEKSALNIRLTKAAGVNAGSYDINAAYDNDNYTVTFEGGKGGYTVNKYDIGGAGDFFLMAGDEASTSGTFTLRYAGQTIELVGYVIFGEIVDLKVVLSQSSINEIGEYDVTASVDDVNYSGSRTFRVIVVNGNGYTKKLVDTLAQLAALTDGMAAATLTAEDFGALKQAAALIAGLDESERETGKDALAPYESLIAAWNDAAADLDAKIETAESIQNALLGGIFGAAATLGLLLAAAYVVGKGGIL